MKKLLLPFILLFTIPFNSSCIKEITYKVTITGSHCTWSEPVDALIGHDYKIKITPDKGYELYVNEGELEVFTEKFILTILGDSIYNKDTDELTIPGQYVNSKITISANASSDIYE